MEKTLSEDYCSYEVAKLLKEKGFDEPCRAYWDNQPSLNIRGLFWTIEPHRHYDREVSAPTHQMAMKWLREVHNLCIAPYAAAYRYGFTIDKCDTGSNICNDDVINEELITFEKAVDAALKYCLTELI